MTAAIGFLNTETLVLTVLALIIGAYLWWMERREQKEKHGALREYATLTAERLAALPDGEVVRAVVANVLAEQENGGSDPNGLLSPGRRGVFGVWLACNEVHKHDLGRYFKGPHRRYAALAGEGFAMLGAAECAAAWESACERYEKQQNGEKELPPWQEHTDALRAALEREQPLQMCVEYIRDNPAEFA